jgi:uncharacterized damage-inducible protein DinB
MPSIADIISYVSFGRSALLKAIGGLSQRELTQIRIYESWTIKDILAHIIGWDRHVIEKLNLILQNRSKELSRVDVEAYNRQSVAARQANSLAEILVEMEATHRQILDILSQINYSEIDRRHEFDDRPITIRSYVIEVMVEHERRHVAEIEQWRKNLDQSIDPTVIRETLKQNRADFMSILDRFDEADVLDKTAVGSWSISDLVGHIADWEQRMLGAAYHIYDPSRPVVPPVGDISADWDELLATARAGRSWPENHHELREIQVAVDNLVSSLKPQDWNLRGPYPWPNDQGTLAELITSIAEHYLDHLPDIKQWYEQRRQKPSA